MHLLPFFAVAAIVVVTPGADLALVTRNALLHGRRPAVATALGINLGILIWTAAAALGLAAVVAQSHAVFTAIKLAGAVYLVYLGVQTLRGGRERRTAPVGGASAFRQGLLSNLGNPKIAVFFTSLLPQFVGAHAGATDLLVLGALFNAMGVAWLVAYAHAAARGRDVLGRPSVRRVLDRVTGVALIALGARLAAERDA